MGWDLIADIGGTNMRLATSRIGAIGDQKTYPTVGKLSVTEAILEFAASQQGSLERAVIAAAGIVESGVVTLTNTGTVITEAEVNAACCINNTKILNDFEAAAWCLASVSEDNIHCLQGSDELLQLPRVIIGPGTGLGVGALVWNGKMPVVVQGEGGHVRLSPDTNEELEIFRKLVALWPEVQMGDGVAVEAEAVLSGTGLPYFYKAICEVFSLPKQGLTASEIFNAAKAGTDKAALKAVTYFTKYLGEVAGDMGVTFSAKGGVFLAGGVIAANAWIFEGPEFLAAFNSGGRHTGFRKKLPIYIYKSGQFGLEGAVNYLKYRR
ncbi:MAG: glucokinase [Salaquimonas sp.]